MTTERNSIPWREVPGMAEAADNMTFGRLMRSWRICEEWSQQVVAQKLGFSVQMVSQLETGKRLPSLTEAVRIAQVLEIPVVSCLRLCLKGQIERAGLSDQFDLDVRPKAG